MEYRKGILFVRLIGNFHRLTYKYFNEEVFPIILKNELKYIVINFDSLKLIDKYGIKSLEELIKINNSYKGRVTFCNLSENVKTLLENSSFKYNFFVSNDELEAVGMFEL